MVTTLISSSAWAAPLSCLTFPFPYWCFLGSHTKRATAIYSSLNHSWPGVWRACLGQPGSYAHLHLSITWTWNKPCLKHMGHGWQRICFPKGILGGNYQNKNKFWVKQKRNNTLTTRWSVERMTPLGKRTLKTWRCKWEKERTGNQQ